jgi:hypothetical protein
VWLITVHVISPVAVAVKAAPQDPALQAQAVPAALPAGALALAPHVWHAVMVLNLYVLTGQSVQERDPVLDTFPAGQAVHAVSVMPPVVSFSFRYLLASGGISVVMHSHTGGFQELSSSTGDARRVERVVVVVGTGSIADDAFDTALVVAQVMRVEQTVGTSGEAVGGGW